MTRGWDVQPECVRGRRLRSCENIFCRKSSCFNQRWKRAIVTNDSFERVIMGQCKLTVLLSDSGTAAVSEVSDAPSQCEEGLESIQVGPNLKYLRFAPPDYNKKIPTSSGRQ